MAKKQKSIQKPSAGEKPGLLPSSRVLLSGAGLAGLSGILMGLAFPGRGLDWLGLVALAPLFAGLARLMDGGLSRRGRWGAALAGCWLAGLAASMWMGGWVVNTAHVYGGLSPVVAAAAGVLGYGTLTGLDLFLFVGAPFVAAWGRPRLLLLMVPFWAAAFQAWTPRFFYWSYGQLMYGADWLVQGVDLVGSSGLNLVYLPLQLVLAGGLLAGLKTPVVPLGELKKGGVVVLVLLGLAGGYGGLRLGQLQALDDEGADSAGSELVANPPAGGESAPVRSLFPARVRLVGIQPDFSLKLLASNPEMSYSDRTMSLGTLLGDSTKALQQTPPGVNPIKGHVGGTLPTVVVWPESVYPLPFTDKGDWAPQAPVMANAVREWTALRRIHLVMASMEVAPSLDSQGRWNGWDYFGAAIHVSPDEKPLELYRKIFLIPFGETIPFGDWFPTYRALLKSWIPQISEFKSGTDYTVFNIAPGVTAAPLICFDATRPDITRGMVERGANLGVVMANLAWFGKTGASPQFAQYVRFRAMENRIPIFLVAQSGESVLINRLGREASPKLPLFEAGSVAAAVTLWPGGGFYTRYGFWVELGFLLGLGVALGVLLKPKMKHLRGG